jgi:hypothetical protein
MQRRSFLKAGGAITLAGLGSSSLLAHVPTHNFDKYDFGSGPTVNDRLYQGPFSADDYPSWNVAMALTASREVAPNYGMGCITYICDEVRQAKLPLPKGTKWQGLRLKAEVEVKGQRYPVRWACRQKLNEDGTLTLRSTVGLGQDDVTGGVPPTGE